MNCQGKNIFAQINLSVTSTQFIDSRAKVLGMRLTSTQSIDLRAKVLGMRLSQSITIIIFDPLVQMLNKQLRLINEILKLPKVVDLIQQLVLVF